MSEHLAVLKKYPLDVKCGLCGRNKGAHHAETSACPVGLRARGNTYRFSETQHFSPKLPRVKKQIKDAVMLLRNKLLELKQDELSKQPQMSNDERDALARQQLQELDYVYWQLFTAIQENSNDKPTKRHRPLIV